MKTGVFELAATSFKPFVVVSLQLSTLNEDSGRSNFWSGSFRNCNVDTVSGQTGNLHKQF